MALFSAIMTSFLAVLGLFSAVETSYSAVMTSFSSVVESFIKCCGLVIWCYFIVSADVAPFSVIVAWIFCCYDIVFSISGIILWCCGIL